MERQDQLLFYSFLQVPGISEERESSYWRQGVRSLPELGGRLCAQQSLFDSADAALPSLRALEQGDTDFFCGRLPPKHYYRIAYSFPEDVMFLDIETTGLSTVYHYVTMTGWIMNGKYDCWLQGTDPEKFLSAFRRARLIVTFNGIRFDTRFLDHAFHTDIFTKKPQLDLMYLCRRYDLCGGQKEIERCVGFIRPDDLRETDGKEAIALWYSFLFGSREALERLICYNFHDILGMMFILDHVFFRRIYGAEFIRSGKPRRFYSRRIRPNRRRSIPGEKTCRGIRKFVKENISSFSNAQLAVSHPYRILGIDLAGKTASRTGLCLLTGNRAETRVAHTDDEIFRFVREIRPSLISIDAPLSLPKGRTTVYDDDPARESAGIVRHCERVLKGRGVNSYPALIRSMQELTKRGIRLAEAFRSEGFPVIECFPGAAQDVIQLPRKRTDESLLKRGLAEFGITGDFQTEPVCHDELDAITASIVGQFFISGYYEPLGIPEENDMIIPQRELRPPAYDLVIGLAGPVATGKTAAGTYIETRGCRYVRYSRIIARELAEKGGTPGRDVLRREGWALYDGHGQYALNQRLADSAAGTRRLVVDGMRHNEDYTFWKEQAYLRFRLIYIDSEYDLRRLRFERRGDDSVNYREAVSAPVERHVEGLRERADFVIENNGSLEQLYGEIDGILSKLR